ncbi:SGNH/GDSL hydrolase family protein [Hoyosella sp. YIM 151337]|uniref:SGNH/GDSL hydrolase family protein n=1 Tax=Hoyosella sp. YIM 151337 TaxID=2992742 RepID=UPI0022367573|nr:SGNH/GDSL hydrolase family protein [Hoyosella sp. YIM 151337]MCW4355057.1 SGNH/GDSL hydrolase family protein [Hoyosella sp. YIM 151337]
MKGFSRFVALGDSQTEGIGDGDELTGLRGWADRLAARIANRNPELEYANLAVRGKLASQVRDEQLDPALSLRPDLATVVAGVNDILRPRFDADEVAEHLATMFAALTAQGAVVATLTFPDVARITPLARPLSGRVHALNQHIRGAARRYGVIVAETSEHEIVTDPRLWCADRLHASPLGHQRIADAVAHALGIPGSDDSWTLPLHPLLPPPAGLRAAWAELNWVVTFFAPWAVRRARGRSSGDLRIPKRPELYRVSDGHMPKRR